MAGTAYHLEALRQQRVIDRRHEAMQRMGGQSNAAMKLRAFEQERNNFEQRMHDHYASRRNLGTYNSGYVYQQNGGPNLHPDKIYPVMYPWDQYRRHLSVHLDPIYTIMYPRHEHRHQHTALNMGIPHYLLE